MKNFKKINVQGTSLVIIVGALTSLTPSASARFTEGGSDGSAKTVEWRWTTRGVGRVPATAGNSATGSLPTSNELTQKDEPVQATDDGTPRATAQQSSAPAQGPGSGPVHVPASGPIQALPQAQGLTQAATASKLEVIRNFFHKWLSNESESPTTARSQAPTAGAPPAAGSVSAESTGGGASGNVAGTTASATSGVVTAGVGRPTAATFTQMKKTADVLKATPVARVAQPAVVTHDRNLVMSSTQKIPVFEFKKMREKAQRTAVKRIPLVDPGTEMVLDPHPLTGFEITPLPAVPYEPMAALPSPAVANAYTFHQMLGEPVVHAAAAELIVIPVLEPAKKVTAEKIAQLVYTLKSEAPYEPLAVTKIDAQDLQLLRGLILFEKKDQCHIAAGIFADLLKAEKPEVRETSQMHLGVCLHEMNLPTEAVHHLAPVIRGKDAALAKDAAKAALEDLQGQSENEVVEALLAASDEVVPKSELGHANYLKAKYFLKKGQYQKALESAIKVGEGDKFYARSQYVASVAEYALNQLDASLTRQRRVAAELLKKGSEKDVLTLFQMNLGRTAFQKAKFRESLEAFQKVPKENSLWMQALQEQGWAQLQSKDNAGAIGNMHSIQSPYFDNVFKPESYVVRSISYLSICQYADAYKSLSYLEHRYSPWLEKMDGYLKTHSSGDLYQTVIKALQTKGPNEVDALPTSALREIAHQRDFLNVQEGLNQLIDEGSGYGFIRGLIEKDRKSLMVRRNATIVKIAELNVKIKKARTTPGAMKNYNAWRFELANNEDFLSVYEFKMATLKEGLEGLNRLMPSATERLAHRKIEMKERAGKILKTHLAKAADNLRQSLENNELLKYEIYAGSGENLRYQMAGGKGAPDKKTVDRKLAGMRWEFDGEFWEDEIGHYRSSMKNNCQAQVAAESTR